MNKQEQERRARLMKMQAERLPEIKRRFEENQNRAKLAETPAPVETGAAVIFEQAQKRNFNSNFKPGGKDYAARSKRKNNFSGDNSDARANKTADQSKNKKAPKAKAPKAAKNVKSTEAEERKVNLSVSTRRGDMVHHHSAHHRYPS